MSSGGIQSLPRRATGQTLLRPIIWVSMNDSSKISPSPSGKVWPQWIASLIIHILSLLVGLVSGWTSPFLAKLTKGTETLMITEDEASWIASLFSITRTVGAIFAAVIVHKFGAKKAVLFNGIPHALAWLCFLIKESVPWIYTARLLSGFAVGMYYSTFPLYVGEIADPKIRGTLISVITQGIVIGTLLGNLIGAYVSMTTFALISIAMTAAFFFGFIVFPDSPHYLVRENRIDAARKSLQFYNRKHDVTAELESLKLFTGQEVKLSMKETFKQLFSPTNRKIVVIVNSVYIFLQLSGLYTITLYMEIILTDLGVKVIAPSLIVVCVGLVGFGAGLISMYTNDRAGRRTMLAVSSAGAAVTLFLLGLNHQLLDMNYDSSTLQYLSISAIIFYQFFMCIGILTIPSCLMSEMFPPQLKEIGTCMANVISAFFAFIVSKSYQPLLDVTSKKFVLWLYALLVFAMFVYTIMAVPETKGKSLQEIQEMFSGKKKDVKDTYTVDKLSNSVREDFSSTRM